MNSLKISPSGAGGILSLGANTLTLTSKGLLFTGSNAYQIGSNGGTDTGLLGATATEVVLQDWASGTLTINALIGGGAGALTKAGSGTTVLNRVQTYTGATYVDAGTLTIGVSNAINSGAGTRIIGPGATLNIPNGITQIIYGGTGGLVMNGGTVSGGGTMPISGTGGDGYITTNGGGLISVATLDLGGAAAGGTSAKGVDVRFGDTLTISSQIVSTGGTVYGWRLGGWTAAGAGGAGGTLILSGNNTWTDNSEPTTIGYTGQMVVIAQNNNALGNATKTTQVNSGSSLRIQDITSFGLTIPNLISLNGTGYTLDPSPPAPAQPGGNQWRHQQQHLAGTITLGSAAASASTPAPS